MVATLARSAFLFAFAVSCLAAQSNQPPPKRKACGSVPYLGMESDNPLSARWITTTVSKIPGEPPKTAELLELVARDNAGRVRVERRGDKLLPDAAEKVTLHTRDGSEFDVTQGELRIIITIGDCPRGKMIILQPGLKVARTMDSQPTPATARGEHLFSRFQMSMLRHNPTAGVVAEDLGTKIIDGVEARGIKIIQFGAGDDEWKGKPIRIFERWVSDDLAAVLADKTIDLKKGSEATSALVDIKREEPDAALFQIPAGFKINPSPAEYPYQFVTGTPAASEPNARP
jgi:hypothetical protein